MGSVTVADSLEAMVVRMDERLERMELSLNKDLAAKCKRIDSHEDRIKRLELHDYAELSLASVASIVVGYAIYAGFLHA